MALALVAVDRALDHLDRPFTYEVPPELEGKLRPGQWVRVPFGHVRIAGCYLGPAEETEPINFQLKPIERILGDMPPLPEELITLARWVSERYACTLASALRLLIPPHARREEVRALQVRAVRLKVTPEEALLAAEQAQQRAPARARLLRRMADAHPNPVPLADLGLDGHAVRRAEELGLVERISLPCRRDPFRDVPIPPAPKLQLTPDQEKALRVIRKTLEGPGPRKPILLHGVTASGKTEVYIRAIQMVVAEGKQAIVMVPEIALTPQLVARFRSRFGDRLAVLHSALSVGERYDEWMRICRGEVDVVIGVRSAVFAPTPRLGLIVLDEEHENTYKQAEQPAYHARDVAEKRAELTSALLILGSATPSVETYFRAEQGKIQKVTMPVRIGSQTMPTVTVVDMRAELKEGNRSIFSRALIRALQDTLRVGQQAILFLNRRGHSTYVFCRECGEPVQCPNCDITLTYHLPFSDNPVSQWLSCHHCGHRQAVPRTCPKCGSVRIRFLGAGTERIEAELRQIFPNVRAVRMDSDTTTRKGSHQAIIEAFEKAEYDVLIGTQMVAKGLDIPNVTLVGVILADTTLNIPDPRSAERTFQLLEQAGGRAGRSDRKGRVIIQTYNPEHYAIQSAVAHDYEAFYRQEIAYRRMLQYPPFVNLIRLVISGKQEGTVAALAQELRRRIKERGVEEAITVVGPCPAPVARLHGQYRYHMLLKGQDLDQMSAAVRQALQAARWNRDELKVAVDVDPRQFL